MDEVSFVIQGKMKPSIKFGTDGWRGVIAEDFTFDNVRRCTQGFARYLQTKHIGDAWIVVGYDNRFGSDNFAKAVTEVLVGNGYHVWFTEKATPTPVISYSIVNRGALAGINITASHNSFIYNGIKIRNRNGEICELGAFRQIETLIPGSVDQVKLKTFAEAEASGKVVKFDASAAYIEHLVKDGLINLEAIRNAGLTVMVDAMWGERCRMVPALASGG